MTTIITKNSSTATAVPLTSDLVQGELAVNVADKRIFTEDATTTIVELGTNPSTITTTTATVTGVLTANGTLASSNAVVTGGTLDGTPVGGTTASTVAATTLSASAGITGTLTGNVTGALTGNVTGNVTGNITGDVTGNVTASSGTTTLNNLSVSGTADFTNTVLANVATPVANADAATKLYVDTAVSAVVDVAPAALDTLNELAAALGDDANFSTTVTNSIATKLPLAGGTMSGAIAMGTSKVTGLGDPTGLQDAATKTYVDTADALKLPLAGGTMSGAIAMGTSKITGVGEPSAAQDVTSKSYVDGILGSATAAATSASNAATSESNASTSASNAATSETNAGTSETNAAASYDSFDDRYLGSKGSDPTLDNDSAALLTGALYWSTANTEMKVYTGSAWQSVAPVATSVTLSQVTDFPSQTGESGKYLTTNGTDPSWADVSASPVAQAVASGSLANGDLVVVNADGTVSVVAETAGAGSAGDPVVYAADYSGYNSATFDSTNNKVVIAYRDQGDSNYGKAIVGTVSGTSISFGSEAVFVSSAVNYCSAVFDSSTGKVVIAYQDQGNSSYGTAIVGTVSGTSISFGTAVVFESGSTQHQEAVFDSTNNKVVISYRDTVNSYYGTAIVGTVSGTSISFGTAVVYSASTTSTNGIAFSSTDGKIIIAYRDDGNSNYGTAIVGTVSGTSISFGTAVVFESATIQYPQVAVDTTNNKVVIAYNDAGNSSYGTAIVGTVSGTSISFGTAVVYNSDGTTNWNRIIFNPDQSEITISYANGGFSYHGYLIVGTVSGTTISFDSSTIFNPSGANDQGITYDSASDKIIIVSRDWGASSAGTAVVYSPVSITANLTAENYIGISDAVYTNGATATIQVTGAVDDAQSGLTAGQAYYVQLDGTLATTPDTTSVFAGTAIASTRLIVKG